MATTESRKLPQPHRAAKRSGIILILVAFLLPAILLFVGFAVDLGYMQLVRTELRATSDLAAKAAASTLSREQNMGDARKAAKQIARRNGVAGEQLNLKNSDIVFGNSERQPDGTWAFTANATPTNAVRIFAERTNSSADGPVSLFFGKLYGNPTFEPSVTSTATFLDVDICLVLDRSSSMKLAVSDTSGGMSSSNPRFCSPPYSDSRWKALENAVNIFLGKLDTSPGDEKIAIVTFSSNYTSKCGDVNVAATLDQQLTEDVDLASQAMGDRSSSVWNGNTEIDKGISLGTQELTHPSRSRTYANKVMIVFTDGVYTGANPVPAAVAAKAAGIDVSTITFSTGANEGDMQTVAMQGGGKHYHAPNADALEKIFETLAAKLTVLTD